MKDFQEFIDTLTPEKRKEIAAEAVKADKEFKATPFFLSLYLLKCYHEWLNS